MMEDRRYYHVSFSEFKTLWESKMHARDIATHFGVSRTFVYQARKEFGLEERDSVRFDSVPDPTPEEIRARKREVRRRHFAMKRAEA